MLKITEKKGDAGIEYWHSLQYSIAKGKLRLKCFIFLFHSGDMIYYSKWRKSFKLQILNISGFARVSIAAVYVEAP